MITSFGKRKKGRFSESNFWLILAVIVIIVITGFLVVSNIKLKQKKDKLENQLAAIEKEIKDFQNKNKELEEGISRIGEEEYIEEVAREDLNLQKEGEKVVSFILPPEQTETKEEKKFWPPTYWWKWLKSKFGF